MSKAQNTALELVDNLTRSGNKVVVAGPGADTRLAGTLVAGGALDNGSSVVRVLNLKESGRFYNTTLVIPPTAPPKNESAPIANSSPGGVATSTTPSNASNVSPVEQGSSPPLPLDKWLALEMTKEIMGWPKN